MKKSFRLFQISIAILILFCFSQCKKNHSESGTVTLYNQTLPVIQSHINGKWKLEYINGGFIANYYNSFHDENVIWQFSLGTRVIQNYNGNIYTDTTITWIRDLGVNTRNDSTYLMKFYSKNGNPYIYVVDRIFNDSLILRDNAVDGQDYHFSKSN